MMFHSLDRARRLRGRLMDAAGLGPDEAPYRVAASRPGFRLRAYGGPPSAPTLLILPAPIKRAYIWDLSPAASTVRRALAAGLRVYLVEWTAPGERTGQTTTTGPAADFGLAGYAGRLIPDALDAVAADGGGRRVLLAGHSLGGTLAAIAAAFQPERVRGLVLLEAPLAFGPKAGVFAPLVAAAPPAGGGRSPPGAVPGSFLTAVSVAAAPDSFSAQVWRDRLASLADPRDALLHSRVIRWTLDEFPMPGRLFADIVESLYRQDLFAQGRLRIGGQTVGPARLRMPILAVVDPHSTVIPPESALAALDALDGHPVRVLHYTGDRGVALRHIGVLVGRSAHSALWPVIFAWMAGLERPPTGPADVDRSNTGNRRSGLQGIDHAVPR